jgi:cellulose synthase/poly-beta-1,6-N-acetylglucosamine synthase-like glycosyltransferase
MVDIIKTISWIISFVLTLYASYFIFISLFALIPQKRREKFQPKSKFAVVIPARNEELVIGNLIDSLQKQKYPRSLFDITVIPNNCTDDTKKVAISRGAEIFECKGTIRSKGDALHEYFDSVIKNNDVDVYDGFCIFDADNIVSEDFLSAMNNAICCGDRVGQGFRGSKNPYDTVISGCYSIYYYIVNRFYNRARSAMNLSGMINGSGFMVCADIIKKQGGWHTNTMTEDLEFTAKCVLSGEKVWWVPDAVFYDEQPLTFEQSWKQRKRWSTGTIQCSKLYFTQLIKNAVDQKNVSCFDLLMFFQGPVMQILSLVSIIFSIILTMLCVEYDYFPQTDVYFWAFLSLPSSYLFSTALAFAVVLIEKKKAFKMFGGVTGFWFFILSWLPINIICLFKKQTEWVQIKHMRAVKISDVDL